MLKKIVNHGHAKAVILDRVLLKSLDFYPEGEVDLRIENGNIVLTPPRMSLPHLTTLVEAEIVAKNGNLYYRKKKHPH